MGYNGSACMPCESMKELNTDYMREISDKEKEILAEMALIVGIPSKYLNSENTEQGTKPVTNEVYTSVRSSMARDASGDGSTEGFDAEPLGSNTDDENICPKCHGKGCYMVSANELMSCTSCFGLGHI